MENIYYLAILLTIISGTAKGARDTIKHHFAISVFDNLYSWFYIVIFNTWTAFTDWDKYGNIREYEKFAAKIKLWIKSDYEDNPKKHPIFFMFHDGWHFSDETHIVATLLSLFFVPSMKWYMPLIFIGLIAVSFNLSYHGFFLQRGFRKWFWFK